MLDNLNSVIVDNSKNGEVPQPTDTLTVKVEPLVAPTFEETFMNQVADLGATRVTRGQKTIRFEKCHFTAAADIVEPKTFKSVKNNKHCLQWEMAMKDEYERIVWNYASDQMLEWYIE